MTLEGGWITLAVTSFVMSVCITIKAHYGKVASKLLKLYSQLMDIPRITDRPAKPLDPNSRIAAILVSGYGGLGLHTLLGIFKEFPAHFTGVVFLSVGVIDSKEFKGGRMIELLKSAVQRNLVKYVDFANGQGISATYRMSIGTDAVEEAEKLCFEVSKEFPHVTFFAGKILFEKEKWYQKILHNETAFAIQKRLQWAGKTMVIIPAKVI